MGHSEYISKRVFSKNESFCFKIYVYIFLLSGSWTKSSLLICIFSCTKISNSPLSAVIYWMASWKERDWLSMTAPVTVNTRLDYSSNNKFPWRNSFCPTAISLQDISISSRILTGKITAKYIIHPNGSSRFKIENSCHAMSSVSANIP